MSREEQYRVAINAILKTLSETCRGFRLDVVIDAVETIHSGLLVQESDDESAPAALNELKDEIDRMHHAH